MLFYQKDVKNLKQDSDTLFFDLKIVLNQNSEENIPL